MLHSQRSEHELRSLEGEVQYPFHTVARRRKELAAKLDFEHEHGENKLQAETPENGFGLDRLAVGGEGIGQPDDEDNAEQAGESPHLVPLFLCGAYRARPTKCEQGGGCGLQPGEQQIVAVWLHPWPQRHNVAPKSATRRLGIQIVIVQAVLRLYREARRRKVFRTGALYVLGAWLVLQVADVLFPGFGIPEAAIQALVWAAVLGFPLALVFGWLYDIGPQGIRRTAHAAADDAPSGQQPLARSDYLILLAFAAIAGVLVLRAVRDIRETP